MKTEYRTIDTSTLKGQAQADKLKRTNNGWEVESVGLFIVRFYRNEKTKANYAFDPEILAGLKKMLGEK